MVCDKCQKKLSKVGDASIARWLPPPPVLPPLPDATATAAGHCARQVEGWGHEHNGERRPQGETRFGTGTNTRAQRRGHPRRPTRSSASLL